jgi:hypothetical protein
MARGARYKLDKVSVEPGDERLASWTFGGRPVSGTEQSYSVLDGNYRSKNKWEFIIRTPRGRDQRIEIRPRATPNLRAWAELPDRSLTFSRAMKGLARGKWYCLVALADPTGNRSRDVVRGDERHLLPSWFDALKGRMRTKAKVRSTKGTDGESLVVLIPANDHEAMIRLFFATKVWVLKERFALPATV